MSTRPAAIRMMAVALAALLPAAPAFSYLPQFVRPAGGGDPQLVRWNTSGSAIRWNLNPSVPASVQGDRSAAQTMADSFARWTAAPNTSLPLERGNDSSLQTRAFDGVNLVCFECEHDFGDNLGTLAVTVTTIATAAGQDDRRGGTSDFAGEILDSDILFNPDQEWSTGSASGHDLQTVAMHEIGHFFGLDHSGVVRAVMFPFAPDLVRMLSYDDVAAIFRLYPSAPAVFPTGAIEGRVTLGGNAVFGAHVLAESVTGNLAFAGHNLRKSPISTLTRPDGTYRIDGLPPDSYTVTAEPLDLPVNNGNVQGYAPAFSETSVQTNFMTRWH